MFGRATIRLGIGPRSSYVILWARYAVVLIYTSSARGCDRSSLFMVALCNRADHYIFMLWFVLSSSSLWSPYVIGQTIIFSSCFFFLLSSSSFFPRLISAVGDWMFTILRHMVWS